MAIRTKTQNINPKCNHKNIQYYIQLLLLLTLSFAINKSQCNATTPEVSMGTTILAVRYKGGVIVAADTRTSVSGYVSNRFASKLTFVLDRDVDCYVMPYQLDGVEQKGERNARDGEETSAGDKSDTDTTTMVAGEDLSPSKMVKSDTTYPPMEDASTCCICRSGSAADTQYLANEVRSELVSRQILYRTRGTVTNAACLLRSMLVDDPDKSAGLICAGYDHVLERGVIYSLSPGGSLFELDEWAAGGSGSTYILGHIDANMPHGEGIDEWEEEEAVEFVVKAIELAMDRDGSSGGFVRLYVINRWGKKSFVRLPKCSSSSSSSPLSKNGRVFSSVTLKDFASPSPI